MLTARQKKVRWMGGINYAELDNINGLLSFIEVAQVNYLNSRVEQDHRFTKKITKPMMGFKAFHSAKITLDEIETAT